MKMKLSYVLLLIIQEVYMAPEIGLARSTSLISVWLIKVIEAKIHFDSVHGI
jgi:hypothetical protein